MLSKIKSLGAIIAIVFLLTSCEKYFEYSPFDAKVKDNDKNQTAANLNLLIDNYTGSSESFSFVTISDSHFSYHDLEETVAKINTLVDIDFVIHLGDMTERGWLKEFEMFTDCISHLNIPIFTCIGNHDYLSNGEQIYRSMFGPFNYSFNHNNFKFVFFDAVTLESDKQPDIAWLDNVLCEDSFPKIILSHIPFFDQQISISDQHAMKTSFEENSVILALHGHHHNYEQGKLWDSDIDFIIPGSVDKRKVFKVSIDNGKISNYKLIAF
jgi:predicted phosphodiesterase